MSDLDNTTLPRFLNGRRTVKKAKSKGGMKSKPKPKPKGKKKGC